MQLQYIVMTFTETYQQDRKGFKLIPCIQGVNV